MRSVFVTGTDTEVGKTVVCGLLAAYLQTQGHRVITQKWIQTGTQDGDEDVTSHAAFMNGVEDATLWSNKRVPYRFALPAAPHLAATQEGRIINESTITAAFTDLQSAFECVVVEGIGGLLVPIDGQRLVVDLAQDLSLPVLVVVANKLGAINHTLLTIEALRQRKMDIVGLVFNDVPDQDPAVAADNPHIIGQHTGLDILGHLPWSRPVTTLVEPFKAIGARIAAYLS
ncbi:dethiobiotin synthase [Planctomycetota bacterium]